MLSLVRFNDEWPTLEKWFDQFSQLKQVDASAGPDDVVNVVEAIVQQILIRDTTTTQVHAISCHIPAKHKIPRKLLLFTSEPIYCVK